MHVPGMAFENQPTGPGRGLRRLATRVTGARDRGGQRATTGVPVDPGVAADPGRPRPAPALRWKNPSLAPNGDFQACAVPNAELSAEKIPGHGDSWETISCFALTYDGYAYWDDVAELATRHIRNWTRHRTLPATIDEIRGCLFYEQRRWHHFGEDPNGRGALYFWALLDSLRTLVAGRGPIRAAPSSPLVTTVAPVRTGPTSAIRSFLDDDPGYLSWASDNGDGFVVNADRTLSPNSLMLHRASCPCIGGPAASGRTRTANYRKVCGPDIVSLLDWCRHDIGTEPSSCRHCCPRSPGPRPPAAPPPPRF